MQISKIKLLLFSFSISVVSVNAQTPVANQSMTLEQCIDYALNNNIQIKQTELNTELSHVNLIQSEANVLPSLSGNASHSYNIGRTVDRFTNQFADAQVLSQNFSLSTDLVIFSGFQNLNTIQQSKFNYLAGKYDIEKMKNDIALNIATAYLQILYSIEAVQNAKDQMGITEEQVERTKKLVDVGSAAKGTLLDIQSQLASEELNLTTAQNQLDIAYLSLAQLLNMTSTDGLTIVKPELTITNDALTAVNPLQIYATAVSSLPEVKSAENKVKGAEKGIDVAWGGISPRLEFIASYGTGYSGASLRPTGLPTFQGFSPNGSITSSGDTVLSPAFSKGTYEKVPYANQYHDNVNKSFGFYLTIPIFNRFQTKASIDKARIQKLNADLTVESTKLQIQKNVQQAYADASAGLKKYNASQKAVDAMQESFKYTEEKFNVGMVNTTDYSTAKNKLIKAQSDLLQAKYEFVFKTKVLDFYQGKPLKF